MKKFRYADIHCHPNLKPFGHSFDRSLGPRADMWHVSPASLLKRKLFIATGIVRFSQNDLTTMSVSGAKIVFVSLYPFEKGFFVNQFVPPALAAFLANLGIDVGYQRIRNIQKHLDYFSDLENEYDFVAAANKEMYHEGQCFRFDFLSPNAFRNLRNDTTYIVLTIEGAHVFNTGLSRFGKQLDGSEVMANIQAVKQWSHPPFCIGLAHNFANDLCGHAASLQRLGKLVDQSSQLNEGFYALGYQVCDALLDDSNGPQILIDVKHMSLASRRDFYAYLSRYWYDSVPIIMSHGALTGRSWHAKNVSLSKSSFFNSSDINLYDEELEVIAKSNGLIGLQMDENILTDLPRQKTNKTNEHASDHLAYAAILIWHQLKHAARVLDSYGLNSWDTLCLGTDFDGSILPPIGVLTARDLYALSEAMLPLATSFQQSDELVMKSNREVSPQQIMDNFFFENVWRFLLRNYQVSPHAASHAYATDKVKL